MAAAPGTRVQSRVDTTLPMARNGRLFARVASFEGETITRTDRIVPLRQALIIEKEPAREARREWPRALAFPDKIFHRSAHLN